MGTDTRVTTVGRSDSVTDRLTDDPPLLMNDLALLPYMRGVSPPSHQKRAKKKPLAEVCLCP